MSEAQTEEMKEKASFSENLSTVKIMDYSNNFTINT